MHLPVLVAGRSIVSLVASHELRRRRGHWMTAVSYECPLPGEPDTLCVPALTSASRLVSERPTLQEARCSARVAFVGN